MGLTIAPLPAIAALLCIGACVSAVATPIYPGDEVPNPDSPSLEERRQYTMQLMEVAPQPTDQPVSAPELTNPLNMDREIALRAVGSHVRFSDLLARSVLPDPGRVDIELPPGTLRGIDILDDLNALYLSYGGRAFDKSVLDIGNAEIVEDKGIPITTDGSPLSLGDFGELTRARKE